MKPDMKSFIGIETLCFISYVLPLRVCLKLSLQKNACDDIYFWADILAPFYISWICFLCAWCVVLAAGGVDVMPRKKDDISMLPMRIT